MEHLPARYALPQRLQVTRHLASIRCAERRAVGRRAALVRATRPATICYGGVFVTSQGSLLTRLRRALNGGDLLAARTAGR